MIALLPAGGAAFLATRHPGSGTFTTIRGRYPVQDLRYIRAPSGRGALQFMAGAGAIGLTGEDAQELGPGRIRLTIDRMEAITSYAAEGACEADMDGGARFRRIVCKGVLGARREPFSVTWTARARGAHV